jgi:hypothetical protein
LGGIGEILDLLGHDDSCNRRSGDIRSGLASGFHEKVLADVSSAGELGELNATVEGKFGEADVSASILKQENKKSQLE